jgi:hypothetical protein
MMAKTKVTKWIKISAEDVAQSEVVAAIADPGTPVSTAAVTDGGTR